MADEHRQDQPLSPPGSGSTRGGILSPGTHWPPPGYMPQPPAALSPGGPAPSRIDAPRGPWLGVSVPESRPCSVRARPALSAWEASRADPAPHAPAAVWSSPPPETSRPYPCKTLAAGRTVADNPTAGACSL